MRVSRIQVVVGFARDDEILLSAGKYLQKLSRELGVPIPKMSVPTSAPPEAPRAIIPGSTTLFQLCLNRAELSTQPPDHVASDFGQSTDFALKAASRFLLELTSVTRYQWVGAISTLDFPAAAVSTLNNAAASASDRLVNVARAGRNLSHFNLQIGFQEDSYFITYSVSGYEIRMGSLQAPISPSFDISSLPLGETGIEIHLDINNKPQSNKRGLKVDLVELFTQKKRKQLSLEKDLGLEGIL